jgi:serine/threonine protein kinase
MIDARGVVKITDFGIAKTLGGSDPNLDITRTGQVVGTLHYMSPEQVNGSTIGRQSDQFSLAVVAYEMLTGVRPFDGGPLATIVYKIAREAPPPPEQINPALNPEVGAILTKALAKDATQRFVTCSDFAAALQNALVSESTGQWTAPSVGEWGPEIPPPPAPQAAPIGSPMPASKTRRRVVAYVAMPIAVGAAALFVLLVWFARRRAAYTPPTIPSPHTVFGFWQITLIVLAISAIGITMFFLRKRVRALPHERVSQLPPLTSQPADPTIVQRIPEMTDAPLLDTVQPSPAGPDRTVMMSAAPAKPSKVSLVVTSSTDENLSGRTLPVLHFPFRIGRVDADLAIANDHGISRTHAAVDFVLGAYFISDTGSANGTYVNGRRVMAGRPEPLPFSATIRLSASTSLIFLSEALDVIPDLSGAVIAGRFTLERPLHTSAKAVMYAAKDHNLPRTVAVKILSPQLAAYPGYAEQFKNEAEVAATLRHAHICRVIEFGETVLPSPAGSPIQKANYLCMEYMPGGSLARRLTEPVAVEVIIHWMRCLGDALDYVHQHELVHAGIKPTSIVFDEEGAVYLTDFAIASRAGGKDWAVMGAPAFLSPEQLEGQIATPASDQYSLSVLAYLLLSGTRPYEGQENPEVRKKNLARGPVAVHQEAARNGRGPYAPAASGVLRRAMSLDPAERYRSAGEFVHALDAALSGRRSRSAEDAFVFLSYRRDSSAGWANHFADKLKDQHGISVFLDVQRVDSAVRFPVRIQKAIEECDVFVCFLAADTLQSDWVRQEIHYAHENAKPMVPVFHESYRLPESNDQLEPGIKALLDYPAVHLLDRKNIHIDHTIADLAGIVQQTVRKLRADESSVGG